MSDMDANAPLQADWKFGMFRIVAFIEGITTLALFLIAMPIKYALGDPLWVSVVGPIHGYAFVAYVMMVPLALSGRGWTGRDIARVFLAALIPFGTFANDPWLKRRHADQV
ncbi:DUF3817 domain-containing protein [Sagittula sp. S175]|uniref:DUF3817 domain-containing protein n=1 Tax=Sagittula sp. S175 TaxID=3415129 RepID=UPI003C7DE011